MTTFKPPNQLTPVEEGRCPICSWPYAESREKGCVPGDCSYRPQEGTTEYERVKRNRERPASPPADVAGLREKIAEAAFEASQFRDDEDVAPSWKILQSRITDETLGRETILELTASRDNFYKIADAILALLPTDAAVKALVGAANLALEYWRHRQQRYKNRRPEWVKQTEEALATLAQHGRMK